MLALNSDEVSLIHLDDAGDAQVVDLDVRPDTNALAVSHNGQFVVAFWDSLFEEESGPPSTDQEISIIDTTPGSEAVYNMSIGLHPMKIVFNDDDTMAFAITEDGINIIDLSDLIFR